MSLVSRFMLGLAALALCGAAVLAGWSAPGLPQPLIGAAPRRGVRLVEPSLQPPGADTVIALQRLAPELATARPVDPTAPARPKRWVIYKPPAPPPPPDVGLVFRREASAIIRVQGQGLAVLLAADPGLETPPRMLKPGDMFDARWRLTGLSMDEAILQDGTSERKIALFDALGAAGAAPGMAVQ